MTDEEPDVVASWVKRMKPAHPVVILKDSRFEDALQVKGFPTVGVIDPEGNLTYAGFRGKEETFVEEGAQRSETGELWPEKLLKKALKLVQAGEEARAYGETLKAIEKATEEADAKWLKRYSAYLEGRAVTAVADSRKYLEEGRVLRALQRAEPYAEAKPQFPSSSDAAAFLTELEALPTYKAELKGGKKFEEALALEKEREFLDAAKVYVAVYKKYKDTKVAAAARDRVSDLVGRGMPGYRSSCQTCRKAKRACEKHVENVKL